MAWKNCIFPMLLLAHTILVSDGYKVGYAAGSSTNAIITPELLSTIDEGINHAIQGYDIRLKHMNRQKKSGYSKNDK